MMKINKFFYVNFYRNKKDIFQVQLFMYICDFRLNIFSSFHIHANYEYAFM